MYLFPELFGTSHLKCNFSTAPPSGNLLFPGYFHDISRIFTWFWQPPFWDLQDIYTFFVWFKKPSTSNLHDISIIFLGYLHSSGSPPLRICRIFTCFSYGLESFRLRISMIYSGYFQEIYMVLAVPFWDLQNISMFFVRFRKLSTSNFHDIFRIFPGYLHGSGSPPFGIYRIFPCFS